MPEGALEELGRLHHFWSVWVAGRVGHEFVVSA
jgi:hypothetical protein